MATFRERYAEMQKNKEGKTQSFRQRYTSQNTDFDTLAEDVKNRTNTWLKNHSTYIANYQDRYSKDEKYRGDSAEWYSTVSKQKQNFDQEAKNITAILDQYSSLGNDSWDNFAKVIKNILSQGESAQSTVTNRALQDDKFASQFASREDYDKWDMGWLAESSTVDMESSQKRKANYEKNQGRIAELDQKISDLKSTIYGSRIVSSGFSPYVSTGDTKENNELLRTLESERNSLIAENNRYENEQKTLDDYYKPETEEFKKNAAYRDYKNIAVGDTVGYGVDEDTAWNTLSSGGYWDKEGNLRDKDDNVVGKSEDSFSFALEDKLGAYLNTSTEDRVAIQNELQKFTNTDHLTAYQNMIFDAENGAWEQLTEGEINIYYDLYKTQGKEAAYKYLSDMKDVLNKRATQEKQEDIRNSEGGEWFGWNVASIPMNVIGGATAFIDDAINVLSGKDVNPYSKAHLWQNMGQAVREETAKDWDEATSNIAIPWLDFSAGDVYQSLMSAADSVGGALAFGKGYSVLMGMGAASSKAKELYERGATKGQVITGALLSGAAELVFESIGLDGLLKAAKAKNLKAVVGNALKQAGVEAFEETGTEIANAINEVLVMGDQSKYGTLDWGDASTFASDVVNAALGGFISGGAGGGTVALQGAAQAKQYQAGVKAHGQAISKFGDVDSLQKHAEEMIKDKNTPNAWEIKKQLKKVQNNPSAKNVGLLSVAISESVQKQNRKESVSRLKKEGLSKKQADAVYDAILQMEKNLSKGDSQRSTLTAWEGFVKAMEDLQLDDSTQHAVSLVAMDMVQNPQNASQTRLRDLMNARVGAASVDPEDIKTLSEIQKKEIKTEGRVSSDGSTRLETTGEAVRIDRENPIAKIENDTVYLNTDHGVVETADLQFANEDELYLYEAVSGLDAGTASLVVTGYNGKDQTADPSGNGQKLSAQDYVQGMLEGILLYGKHNFQTVGADISEDGYFAGLSETDQQTALKLGRELRAEETRQRTARVREAIERAKAKKDAEAQKNTAEDGGEEKRSFSSEFEQKTNDSFGISKPRDSVHVQKQVMKTLVKEGFFKDAEHRRTVVVNKDSGMEVEINRSGIEETFDHKNFGSRGRFIRIAKLATIRQIDEAIEKGKLVKDDVANEHDSKDFNKRFAYIEYQTVIDGSPVVLKLSIKKSQQKNKFWVHSIYVQKNATERRKNTKNSVDKPYISAGIDNSIAQNSEIVKTEGKVFFDDSVELSELTKKQRAEVEYAGNVISAVIGNEIHFFDSRHVPADSREARTNGWYDSSDGSIHLDIAKVENGEKSVLFSLSHELVHFIEDWSAAKYQTFADFLLKNYAEHGVSTQKLLERKMAELKTTDYDYAMSELVADACERMLLDSNASEKLAELNKTDSGLVAKIKAFLANTLKKIRQAYAQYKGREEAQLLQKMEDKLSEFYALFEDALTDAAQNYRDADGKLASAEVREQAKKSNITVGMSEAQRADLLRTETISPIPISVEKDSSFDWDSLEKNRKSIVEKPLIKKLKDLGFLKSYETDGIDVSFEFTGTGLRKSMNSQVSDYGGSLADLTKVVLNLQELLDNAVLMEIHRNKKNEKNSMLMQVYVLLSAYREGGYITPVQFEIKQNMDEKNRLYLAVALTKIETSVMGDTAPKEGGQTHLLLASEYSIPQFAEKINPKDQNFFKYIPDEFLNDSQKRSKQVALEKDAKKYGGDVHYQQKLVSNRHVLIDAIEASINTQTRAGREQAEILNKYRSHIGEIEELQDKIREFSVEIKAIMFSSGKRDVQRYNQLIEERNRAEIRLNQLERKILKIETLSPLKDLVVREKAALRKRLEKKGREMTRNAVKTRVEQIERQNARKKLYNFLESTRKWIQQPTKSQTHCPDIFKQPLLNLLKGIQGERKGIVECDGWMVYDALGSFADAFETGRKNAEEQSEAAMEYITQGYLDLPDDFVENLRSMARDLMKRIEEEDLKRHEVFKLSSTEIKALSKTIRQFRHAALETQKLHTISRFANAEEMGRATMAFLDALGKIDETSKIGNFIDWENVTPFYIFKRFGEGGLEIFNSFLDAHGKMARHAQTILAFQEKNWTKKEVSEWEHQEILVELKNGKKLRTTAVEAMSIYCLSRRYQAERHLYGDGIVIAGEEKVLSQKTDTKYKLQRADVEKIVKQLSVRQIEVADAIQQFFATECAEWGNEISMKRFLERRYTEQFYFPLETVYNEESEKKLGSGSKRNNVYRLLNISATKDTDVNARNSVYVRNIFDVFASHSSDMARMNAFGMPLLDFMKWFNHVEVKVDGKKVTKTGSVRESMGNAFGKIAESYVSAFIDDVNGSGDAAKESEFLMKMIRAYKTAAVGGNLRVAALQLTAYPKAAAVLDWNSLSVGSRPDNLAKIGYGIRQAEQYSGMAAWKFLGFYDTNVTRSIEAQIKDGQNLREKLIELSLKGAEWGDKITIGMLWNACEHEVQKKGSFEVGSEEFYRAVGQKLNEVIVQTQVVDSVVTRSQTMRKKTGMWQEVSAFMGEPTLSHSIVEDCRWEFLLEKRRTGNANVAWKRTRKYIFKRLGPLTATVLLATVVEMLFEDLRSDDDEEEKKPLEIAKSFLENLNPLNNIPIVSELSGFVWDAMLSLFGVEVYEPSVSRMDSEYLTSMWRALQGWVSIIKNGSESDTTFYNALNNTVKAFSQTSGIPMSNAMREIVTLWNNIFKYVNPSLKIRKNKATSAEERKSLYNAYVNGDAAQIERYRSNYDSDEKWTAAVRTALKENDPRILQAAIAQLNGNASERVRIQKEVIGEGNFSQDLIVTATNGLVTSFQSKIRTASEAKKTGRVKEYEKIVKELQEAGYSDDLISKYVGEKVEALQKEGEAEAEAGEKATSWYKSSDVADAYASGDEKLALEIINDLVRVKTANSTEEKAEDKEKAAKSSVKSLVTEYWKPKYKEAHKNENQEEMKRIRYILKGTGLYGNVDELIKTCNRWLNEKE